MNPGLLKKFALSFLLLMVLLCAGCGAAENSASFIDAKSGVSITIELDAAHPYLAEYERKLIVRRSRQFERQYQLPMDTGGYGATNLYGCSDASFMLDSYSELVVIDTEKGVIHPGKCHGEPTYLGIFDGGGDRPWKFFPAPKRPEMKLEMRGG